MSTATETVNDRIELALTSLSPAQMAFVTGLVLAVSAGLLFAQEPAMHDSLHNFRHSAGITCH